VLLWSCKNRAEGLMFLMGATVLEKMTTIHVSICFPARTATLPNRAPQQIKSKEASDRPFTVRETPEQTDFALVYFRMGLSGT